MGDIKTRFALEGESAFRSAMTNAANAIKVLNAEQKLAKASFQQTGDAEKYAAAQASILQQKITQQKAAVQAAQQAIKQLTDNGVNPASRQFQQWQTKLYNAQTALTNMETELQNVNGTMQQTTQAAEGTGNAIETIGKKVSFDAVISGIGKITDKMAAAANKAKELALEIANAMKDAASWADDLATTATVYGLSTDEVQRMRYTADILDTSFEAILKSRQKLVNAMQSDSDVFGELGVQIREASMGGKYGPVEGELRNWEDVFWDLGAALTNIEQTKGFEYVNKQAQQLLGRNWEQLKPIFNSDWASADNYLGRAFDSAREYYEAVMESWNTVSEEDVNKLTKYDDALQKLGNEFQTLQETVLAQLAPGFTDIANTVGDLVAQLNQYLQTDEGKEKLQALSDAVSGLFNGLTDIDFGQVLETATGALDSLQSGLEWIKNNGNTVVGIIEGLAAAFGLLKVSEGVLTFMQLLASGKYLFSNGQITGYNAGASGAGAAAASGASSVAGTALGATVSKVLSGAQINLSVNGGPIIDWLTHESPFGTIFQGTETVSGWAERQQKEIQQRVDSFAKDWAENALVKLFTDRNANQDAAERLPEGADWRPSYMKDQQPVPVETEPVAPADAAENIAGQIGTVQITVQPVVSDLDWRPSYMQGFGHANGLFSVPFDGYPAILHKGERVMTAREVQSRSYNSNLYVESMYMNNGTDATGLASAMAAAQRRTMSGLGS